MSSKPRPTPSSSSSSGARSGAPLNKSGAPRPSSSSSSSSSSSAPKRVEYDPDETRVLIDWHHVGAIIGKGGANVKRIREESGSNINIIAPSSNIPSPQQIDRIMTIRGNVKQVTKAVYLLADTVVQSLQQRAKERKENGQDTSKDNNGQTSIKLLVHRAAVGAVIGKGGESIRTTQADTGARIQVSAEPLPHSTDKTVTITGSPAVIETAVEKVLNQLAESPLRPDTLIKPFIPGPSSGYGYNYGNNNGNNNSNYSNSYVPSYVPPMTGDASGPISIQKIAIPTICAGCVIGRGGQIIRDLRARSGTNISIADPDQSNPDERVVCITGSPQGIQTAVTLIKQCVESYVPPADGQGEENVEEQQ